MTPLTLCLVSSEVSPLAKTGGLGDVVAALAVRLARRGWDVRLFAPFYAASRAWIAAREHPCVPVDFLRRVPLELGPRRQVASVWTTPLPGSDLWIYLLDCPELYDRPSLYPEQGDEHVRFAGLCRGALESCQRMGWGPRIFHLHDWQAALVPVLLRGPYAWDSLFAASRTLLTIHNVAFQGVFDRALLPEMGLAGQEGALPPAALGEGRVNLLAAGIAAADRVSTVSPTHAREIRTVEGGMGLGPLLASRGDDLVGILNGIDDELWNPATDPHLACPYSAADLAGKAEDKRAVLAELGLPAGDRLPLAGVVSRLTHQKGFDLVGEVLPALLSGRRLRLAALGSGEARYEGIFQALAGTFPDLVAFRRGFDEGLAHRIQAGADLFLMPSRYEPCGLTQMYSLRYGTPPVVRRTGGLADTVRPYDPATGEGTGFVFEPFESRALLGALEAAFATYAHPPAWRRLARSAMVVDVSWEGRVEEYEALYAQLGAV